MPGSYPSSSEEPLWGSSITSLGCAIAEHPAAGCNLLTDGQVPTIARCCPSFPPAFLVPKPGKDGWEAPGAGDPSLCLCFAAGDPRSFIFSLCLPAICSISGSLCSHLVLRSVGTLTLPH